MARLYRYSNGAKAEGDGMRKNPLKAIREAATKAHEMVRKEPFTESMWVTRFNDQGGLFLFERRKGIFRIWMQTPDTKGDSFFGGMDFTRGELEALQKLLKEILR